MAFVELARGSSAWRITEADQGYGSRYDGQRNDGIGHFGLRNSPKDFAPCNTMDSSGTWRGSPADADVKDLDGNSEGERLVQIIR